MRKLILFVMVVLGTTLQAQSFDFSCEANSVTVTHWITNSDGITIFQGLEFIEGGDAQLTTETMTIEGLEEGEVALTTTSTLLHDLIDEAGYSTWFNTIEGSDKGSVTVIVIPESFDYEGESFNHNSSVSNLFDVPEITPAQMQALEIETIHNGLALINAPLNWGALQGIIYSVDPSVSILDYESDIIAVESGLVTAKEKIDALGTILMENEEAYGNLVDLYQEGVTTISYVRTIYNLELGG